MPWKSLVVSLAFGLAACSAVGAETPSSEQCELDDAAATACRMSDTVGADGTHTMVFTVGQKRVEFVGKSQTGWWSGKLDGHPAMGRELNRGHIVFSTVDLDKTFEWWSKGSEHGSY